MGRHRHQEHNSTKNIKTAFFLNPAFTIFEIFGGIWANSMAILSDAIQDLGDSLSLGFSWYLDRKSKKKGNETFSFCYQRFSLLGALINGVILIGGLVNGAAALRMKGGKSLNERVVSWHFFKMFWVGWLYWWRVLY